MTLDRLRRRIILAILDGMASLVDSTILYAYLKNGNGFAQDREALSGDWKAVGNDLWKASQTVSKAR